MPWNLLLFPLVAGYYLLTRSYFFKFIQQRLDRQRLIFESILLGAYIGLFTYLLRLIAEHFMPSVLQSIYLLSPFQTQYTITSILTLFIAIGFCSISNWFLDEKNQIKKAIRQVGNEMELLMEASVSDKKLLLFTLNNNKFYIAWVKELPIPSVSNYVRVIPAISGYRNEEKDLVFTSHYVAVYSEYISEGKIKNIDDLDVDLVIDMSQVISISSFNPEMFSRFNGKQTKED